MDLSRTQNFKENKKGVNEVRKGESLKPLSMRNSMEDELTRENDTEGRWKE